MFGSHSVLPADDSGKRLSTARLGRRDRVAAMAAVNGFADQATLERDLQVDEQRLLLSHANAVESLRRDMIESLGTEMARRLLTRMGYRAGISDAVLARKLHARMKPSDETFLAGLRMHCLPGTGPFKLVRLAMDGQKGAHHGEFFWSHPVDDERHVGPSPHAAGPDCWIQIGYMSGYSTEFMGRQILYREVECQSTGHAACRIVGMPAQAWGEEAARDLRYLMPAAALADHAAPLASGAASTQGNESADPAHPIGVSPGFHNVLSMVRRVAPTQATVLLLGESGTGKEVFAHMLHRQSTRSHKPFVAVNCASIPEQLIEAELFGVERGAFTGATHSRAGRFERAEGGTLFLDEIGSMPAGAQGMLLRALQEREIERLGDTHTRKVDVRVIAATHIDLRAEAAAGRFRQDLFFRLNVFPIRVLPLRERREDIPLLLRHFLAKFNRVHGRRLTGFTQRAWAAAMSYDWPGNIRELENIVERGVILAADSAVIDTPQLFIGDEKITDACSAVHHEGTLLPSDPSQSLGELTSQAERVSRALNSFLMRGEVAEGDVCLDDVETLLLTKALERTRGNVAAAARAVGLTRPQMVYRLRSHGITLHDG